MTGVTFLPREQDRARSRSRKEDRSPGTRSRDGFLDTGPTPLRLIGGSLSLPRPGHSRDADVIGSSSTSAPCSSPAVTGPEPDRLEWTSKGTDVFLGRRIRNGLPWSRSCTAARQPMSPDRCLVQRSSATWPRNRRQRDEGTQASKLDAERRQREGSVRAIDERGLIGVIRRPGRHLRAQAALGVPHTEGSDIRPALSVLAQRGRAAIATGTPHPVSHRGTRDKAQSAQGQSFARGRQPADHWSAAIYPSYTTLVDELRRGDQRRRFAAGSPIKNYWSRGGAV